MSEYVALKQLKEFLKAQPQEKIVRYGFGRPHCDRGDYSQCAFDPQENARISDMLAFVNEALSGKVFHGWKGGEYTFSEYTDAYIADHGDSGGDKIGPTLLAYWRDDDVSEQTE